jgi:protein involved in polysaccharide export with SLBB domain
VIQVNASGARRNQFWYIALAEGGWVPAGALHMGHTSCASAKRYSNDPGQAKLSQQVMRRQPIDAPVRIMRTLFLLPAFILFTLAASPAETRAQTQPADAQQTTMLAPGDSVRVIVWRKPEMSGDFIVAPDGSITHPLYKSVRVGGVPFNTAESNVRTFLARFEQDPQFVLEPLVRVAVSGEVGRPQVFAVRPETTIGEAVAQAGGPNQFGKRDAVRVLRRDPGGRQREFVVSLLDPQNPSATVRVHSGDQIVVDRRRSFFRDVFLPAIGVIGSAASIYLVVDRANRN